MPADSRRRNCAERGRGLHGRSDETLFFSLSLWAGGRCIVGCAIKPRPSSLLAHLLHLLAVAMFDTSFHHCTFSWNHLWLLLLQFVHDSVESNCKMSVSPKHNDVLHRTRGNGSVLVESNRQLKPPHISASSSQVLLTAVLFTCCCNDVKKPDGAAESSPLLSTTPESSC